MRKIIPFNDGWSFAKPGEEAVAVTLPHTWNAIDGQDGGNDYWRGTATYTKTFPMPQRGEGERVFVEFNGAAMTADVTLNDVLLAHHEGGFSTFRADLTDALKAENTLTVSVDNSINDRVYPQKADFTFYGGLYRDVNLVVVPSEHFELLQDGTPGIKVTPVVDLDHHRASVTVETWQNASQVTITVNGETKVVSSIDSHAQAEFIIDNVHLWDGVEDPWLYTASAKLECGDEISTRFGCRVFRCDPEKGFFLNGRSYPLRGVCRHQDRMGKGNALSAADHAEDMKFIREIGANTLRLAHYQHAQEFYDLCDENGIVVWAEIPYITMHMENGRQNTLDQMRELITQCYNHPCIAVWGLSNEITASGEVNEELLENHRLLNALCHRMDSTRLTTLANVFMLETDSPILEIPDINSYNLYFGWYLGELAQNDRFFDDYHAKFPERVIGFSEYGADANPQFHSSSPERGDYTEEYQCLYHEHLLKCIEDRPYLWATHVWNLFDFAADGRDEGGKKGVNQKGLVTIDRELKKDAFYLYKAAWSKEPFVHLCGRRYAERAENETEIRVYSNQEQVTLYMDGTLVGAQAGRRVFTFTIPLTATHEIRAVAGDCTDAMTIHHADKPNPDYQFVKTEIVNWFDKEEYHPECYSIRDTLGELKQNPQAAVLCEELMGILRATRGDVARSSAKNAGLEKMMEHMRLDGLIKQVGDAVDPDAVRSYNEKLQRIRKK